MAALPIEFSRSLRHQFADLAPRFLSGLVLGCIALASVWAEPAIFGALWLCAALMVLWEWQSLVGQRHRLLSCGIGAPAIFLSVFLVTAGQPGQAVFCLLVASALLALFLRERGFWPALGILYSGALAVAVTAIRLTHPYGAIEILWLYAIVWGTDIFSYFGGRLIGGAKLLPKISPGKTWSGTLTGMLCGALFGTLLLALCLGPSQDKRPFFFWFILALALAAVSQAGDILESLVKRQFGAKDSGVLIPGHGGFMDRLDGFAAAVSFAALLGPRLL